MKIGADQVVAPGGVQPALAWTGTDYSVLYSDARTGDSEIYCRKVGANGTLGTERRITTASGSSLSPSVAWTGSRHGVVWQDDRDGNAEIYFARLDINGVKIGADVRVTNAPGSSILPRIVWTGREFAVAWMDRRSGTPLPYFRRLDSFGNPIGGEVLVASTPGISFDDWASLVWRGAEYAVAYAAGAGGTVVVRLGVDGQPTGNPFVVTGVGLFPDNINPALVWTGREYGLVWSVPDEETWLTRFSCDCATTDSDHDGFYCDDCNDASSTTYPGATELCDGYDNDCDGEIDNSAACHRTCDDLGSPRHARLYGDSAAGSVAWTGSEYGVSISGGTVFMRVDANGTPLSTAAVGGFSYEAPAGLVWTGAEYGIAFRYAYNPQSPLLFARLDATTGLKIGADVPVAPSGVQPALAWTGTDSSVLYSDPRTGDSEIYFRKIGATGILGTERRITTASGSSLAPSVAWTGSGHGVVWQDDRDGNAEIYFARLGANGVKIGSDVRVTNAPGLSTWPRIVWTGQDFAVAWIDRRDGVPRPYFQRLGISGNPIGGEVLVASTPGDHVQ